MATILWALSPQPTCSRHFAMLARVIFHAQLHDRLRHFATPTSAIYHARVHDRQRVLRVVLSHPKCRGLQNGKQGAQQPHKFRPTSALQVSKCPTKNATISANGSE